MIERKTKRSKKILKLVKLKPLSERQEWVNRQIKKLLAADKVIIITHTGDTVNTGWYSCSPKDIVYMCESLKLEIMMDEYVR